MALYLTVTITKRVTNIYEFDIEVEETRGMVAYQQEPHYREITAEEAIEMLKKDPGREPFDVLDSTIIGMEVDDVDHDARQKRPRSKQQ